MVLRFLTIVLTGVITVDCCYINGQAASVLLGKNFDADHFYLLPNEHMAHLL